MKRNILTLIITGLLLCSCSNSDQNSFNLNDYMDTGDYTGGDEIRVPFTTKRGVKYIPCLLNGLINIDMIFDSGCSGATISIEEANYLASKGVLTMEDYKRKGYSGIADGSIVENMVFNIRSIVIDNKLECTDVEVTVINNPNAPLLLGNDILDRLPRYIVDNENQEIVFILN